MEGEGRFTLKENMLNLWYQERVLFVNETVRAKLQAEVLKLGGKSKHIELKIWIVSEIVLMVDGKISI